MFQARDKGSASLHGDGDGGSAAAAAPWSSCVAAGVVSMSCFLSEDWFARVEIPAFSIGFAGGCGVSFSVFLLFSPFLFGCFSYVAAPQAVLLLLSLCATVSVAQLRRSSRGTLPDYHPPQNRLIFLVKLKQIRRKGLSLESNLKKKKRKKKKENKREKIQKNIPERTKAKTPKS